MHAIDTSLNARGHKRRRVRPWMISLLGLVFASGNAWADAALTEMKFNARSGGQVELRLTLSDAIAEPKVFTTDDPPRIAVDLAGVRNGLTERNLVIGSGATKSVTAVEAAGRTRVVVDLMRPTSFETQMDGNDLIVTIAGAGDGFLTSSETALDPNKRIDIATVSVAAVDFRRGPAGEGRVIIDFSAPGAAVDLKQEKDKLTINMANVNLPEELAKRLDTLDFATPVKFIDIASNGLGSRAIVTTSGAFEQLAYQTGNQYVLEIAPIKKEIAIAADAPKPKYSGSRVTFNFQDIPVRSALQLIADISQLNIVVADTVQGNATLRLINVPWDQALDLILDSKGLDKRMNGNVIWVAPAKEIADREQQLADARLAMEDRAELETVYIPINYGKADAIATLMTTGSLTSANSGGGDTTVNRRGFLSPRGSVSFDRRTNTLLVNDIAPRIEQIRDLIRRLDRPVQQVMIESRIVVANDSYRRELGARFGFTGIHEDSQGNILSTGGRAEALDRLSNNAIINRYAGLPSGLPVATPGDAGEGVVAPPLSERLNVNLPVANPAGSFAFAILGQDYLLDLELSALQQEGKGEVLSNPRVVTASQQEAVIRQGQQIPFVVVQQLQGGAGGTVPQVQFKDAVLELKVTPLISPDQKIFLNLDVSNDSLSGFTPGVNPQPIIDTRRVTTAVLVDSGETVVIGGIYEQSSNYNNQKVPFLGDLPGVGPLFRTTAKRDGKSELLVFVTPKILDDGAVPIDESPVAVSAQ
jgi:type IV pilus assembly protein PilQ